MAYPTRVSPRASDTHTSRILHLGELRKAQVDTVCEKGYGYLVRGNNGYSNPNLPVLHKSFGPTIRLELRGLLGQGCFGAVFSAVLCQPAVDPLEARIS